MLVDNYIGLWVKQKSHPKTGVAAMHARPKGAFTIAFLGLHQSRQIQSEVETCLASMACGAWLDVLFGYPYFYCSISLIKKQVLIMLCLYHAANTHLLLLYRKGYKKA